MKKNVGRIGGVAAAIVGSILFAGSAAADTWYCNVAVVDAYGTSREVFVEDENGFAYCKDRGFKTMTDFTGTCGVDEWTYMEHDWDTNTWYRKDSGSKNGCWPLFSCIRCGS